MFARWAATLPSTFSFPPTRQVVRKLEAELDVPSLVRMHWTGCPNSCGQVGGTHPRFLGGSVSGICGWLEGRVRAGGGC